MKINEVISREGYETGEPNRKLAAIGRVLMDKAATTKDDNLSNIMAKVGNELTAYNTSFGPRSVEELLQRTSINKELLMKLMKFGEAELKKSGDVRKGADVPDEPEDDDMDKGPDDDDIGRDADEFARGK